MTTDVDMTFSDLGLPDSILQALEKVGLLFGRFCYCKGSAGWFPVKKGTLQLSQLSNGTYRIQLDFSEAGMPQKVPQIDAIVSANESKK